jgi:hypothetical protein
VRCGGAEKRRRKRWDTERSFTAFRSVETFEQDRLDHL